MTDDNVIEFPGGLDANQFRVSGSDSKGHFQRIWVNFQPMHVHMADVLSGSGKFPYRNRGDLIRHGVVRHFHWLEKIHRPVNSVTGALDAMNAVLREAEFRLEFETFINKMVKMVDDLVEAGDGTAARKLVLEVLRKVQDMPEGYWKDKYIKTIYDKSKRILKEDLPMLSAESLFGTE
jgi:hypothetical protein